MCEVTIEFYGVLAEIAGTKQTVLNNIDDINNLKQLVNTTYPKMNHHNYLIAVNNKITNGNLNINNGSKIALMPPFSGG